MFKPVLVQSRVVLNPFLTNTFRPFLSVGPGVVGIGTEMEDEFHGSDAAIVRGASEVSG